MKFLLSKRILNDHFEEAGMKYLIALENQVSKIEKMQSLALASELEIVSEDLERRLKISAHYLVRLVDLYKESGKDLHLSEGFFELAKAVTAMRLIRPHIKRGFSRQTEEIFALSDKAMRKGIPDPKSLAQHLSQSEENPLIPLMREGDKEAARVLADNAERDNDLRLWLEARSVMSQGGSREDFFSSELKNLKTVQKKSLVPVKPKFIKPTPARIEATPGVFAGAVALAAVVIFLLTVL